MDKSVKAAWSVCIAARACVQNSDDPLRRLGMVLHFMTCHSKRCHIPRVGNGKWYGQRSKRNGAVDTSAAKVAVISGLHTCQGVIQKRLTGKCMQLC